MIVLILHVNVGPEEDVPNVVKMSKITNKEKGIEKERGKKNKKIKKKHQYKMRKKVKENNKKSMPLFQD